MPMLGRRNSADSLGVMKVRNARGCIYVHGSATTFASAGFVMVGTWSQGPPPYDQCFEGMALMP